MPKRARTEDMENIDELKHYPIYEPLNTLTTLYVNKLKKQEIITIGRDNAVESLKQQLTDKTIPKSFPKTTFLNVSEPYQKDADELTNKVMEKAFIEIMQGLINIRTKERDDERQNKCSIESEYDLNLTNKVRGYHAAGALDEEEVPLWIQRFKCSLERQVTRESKILKMKNVLIREKKDAAATKKREQAAIIAVDDAMRIEESDTIKIMQKQIAQLTKQRDNSIKPAKESPKGKALRKKERSASDRAGNYVKDKKQRSKRQENRTRNHRSKGQDTESRKSHSHSKPGTSQSDLKGKHFQKKRN